MFSLRSQLELETVFLIIIASIFSIFILNRNHKNNNYYVQTPVMPISQMIPTVTPTQTPQPTGTNATFVSSTQTFSQNSSDGSENLILKVTTNSDKTKTYSFFINNNNSPIFYKTVDSSATFLIPFNTFSIDNKDFFIEEDLAATSHFLVFNTDGSNFSNGQSYLDITTLFNNYTPNYTLNKVTGWADSNLLVVNSFDANKNLRSFWFNIDNSAFIPLSNNFP